VSVAIGNPAPSLDPGEETLDPWTIAPDSIAFSFCFEDLTVAVQRRDQVLRARENEDIRFIRILIFRQAFVGLSRDRRERQIPSQPEWPIARA
jgi:hypothetical protein